MVGYLHKIGDGLNDEQTNVLNLILDGRILILLSYERYQELKDLAVF